MIAQVCDLDVGRFIWTGGDTHIYLNHTLQVMRQLRRKPYSPPQLVINKDVKSIDEFTVDDIMLYDYKYHPALKAAVSV